MQRSKSLAVAAVTVAASLSLTACLGGGDTGGSGGGDDGAVTIWTSMDEPIVEGLEASLGPKAEEAGIEVTWERVTDINTLIMTKLNASDAPDIAIIPQPGVVANMQARNGIQPLDDVLDMEALEQSMLPGVIEVGTVDDQYYGLQVNASLKSLVFYPKKDWDKAGYEAPETLDDLKALTEQIKQDGGTPWCMGIESDTATGWPATDWFEDLVMKFGGAETYNQWVSHEIPFTDDVVVQAGEYFADLMFTEGNVLGGREAIASTNFGAAGTPMFEDPEPGCWLLKQGTFITGFFPKDVVANLDEEVGVFGFPAAEAGGDNPVLGAGDLATMLSDDENTQEVMRLLAETDTGTEAAKTGAYLSPHADFDPNGYPNEIMKTAASVAAESSALLFDGSDQMPGEVGAGSFWKEITAWVTGDQELETALKNIDESWPAS